MFKKERRKAPRAPIELKVEYKRVNIFIADYTKNISKGGIFIKTEKPFEEGTEFIFFLHIPGLKDPLRLKGKVQWILRKEEAKEGETPGMGIKFIYENEDEKRKIESTVEKLIREYITSWRKVR